MTDSTEDTLLPEPEHSPTQPVWSGWDVVWVATGILVSLLGGTLLLGIVFHVTGHLSLQSPGVAITVSVASAVLESAAFIGSIYLFGLRRRHLSWLAVGVRQPEKNWLQYAFWIGLLVIPASGFIASMIQIILGLPQTNPQLPFLAPDGFNWFGAIGLFLFGGIIAPFGEEIFFRGVLYQWLRDRFGMWPGMLISSLIFGLAHGDVAVGGAAAILGIVLAWTFEKSQSIWPPVLIHVINNSAKIILIYGMLAAGVNLQG